jgi:hypothetical protein
MFTLPLHSNGCCADHRKHRFQLPLLLHDDSLPWDPVVCLWSLPNHGATRYNIISPSVFWLSEIFPCYLARMWCVFLVSVTKYSCFSISILIHATAVISAMIGGIFFPQIVIRKIAWIRFLLFMLLVYIVICEAKRSESFILHSSLLFNKSVRIEIYETMVLPCYFTWVWNLVLSS